MDTHLNHQWPLPITWQGGRTLPYNRDNISHVMFFCGSIITFSPVGFVAGVANMNNKNTTIHVQLKDIEELDSIKKEMFDTNRVPYRTVIRRLIAEHRGDKNE